MKNVSENIIGDSRLYKIYGIVGRPFWQSEIFFTILAIIFILICVFLVIFLLKKLEKNVSKENCCEKALKELCSLKIMLLQGKISHKDFYLILTDIVKKYLFGRFGYDLFGLTDQELVRFLYGKDFDKNLLEDIKNMFFSMEVIKFANKSTIKELMESDLLKCVDLVNKTIIKKLVRK